MPTPPLPPVIPERIKETAEILLHLVEIGAIAKGTHLRRLTMGNLVSLSDVYLDQPLRKSEATETLLLAGIPRGRNAQTTPTAILRRLDSIRALAAADTDRAAVPAVDGSEMLFPDPSSLSAAPAAAESSPA